MTQSDLVNCYDPLTMEAVDTSFLVCEPITVTQVT